MSRHAPAARSLVALAAALLACGLPGPLAAQLEAGPAGGVADTHQNAVTLGAMIAKHFAPRGPVQMGVRAFLDVEIASPDFKEGLGYAEPEREWVVDTRTGVRQRPEGDALWQSRGPDAHLALYGTIGLWRVHAGGGVAYNGLDGTTDAAAVLIVYLGDRTELDLEVLDRPGTADWRWRMRCSFVLWRES